SAGARTCSRTRPRSPSTRRCARSSPPRRSRRSDMTSSRTGTERPTVRLVGGGLVPLGERARTRPGPTTPLLALSLGPVVGFALRWDHDHVKSGSTRIDLRGDEAHAERLVRFQSFVRELLDTVEPGLVAYQRPHELRR